MHHISYIHHNKIWNVFKKFEINQNTEIVVQDTVDSFCPIMIYFNILKPHIKFWMNVISLSKMIRRICYKHPCISKRVANKTTKIDDKNVTKYMGRVWNKLLELNACPWITTSTDDKFKLYSPDESKHHIRSRICLYYMVIRRYYMNLCNKSVKNKNTV